MRVRLDSFALDQRRMGPALLAVTLTLTLTLALALAVLVAPTAPSAAAAPMSPFQAGPADDLWAVPAAPATLVITTTGGAPVVSKDDYVSGAAQLDGLSYPLQIKGRGNSTWGWAKKPYKLKLDQPAGLLGMPSQREWVLLANFADRSNLRNHLALQLARRTRLNWSPDTRFVDVILNGAPQGLYLLVDQVEQGTDRVELPKDSYLLEIDERFRSSHEPGFRSRRGTPVSFKDPDELERAQVREVKQGVRAFERALYGRAFADPKTGYRAYVDVDTFIDWYLVEELFRNQDSNFYSSTYVTWTPGRRFAMGPAWDFDLSAGTKWNAETAPQGWHTRNGRHWIARMLEDPAFSAQVKERWADLVPLVEDMVAQASIAEEVIAGSAATDWAQWRLAFDPVAGSRHADTFDSEVAFLRNWLEERTTWMSEPEVIFDLPSSRVREHRRVVRVPVRVLAADRPVSVDYAWQGGTATRGKDFTMTDGTLRFAPGETVKSFPVRIRADRRPEPTEDINLVLGNPDGARLGSPERLLLEIGQSDQRPDVQIRADRGPWRGRGLHARPAPDQTVRSAVRPGTSRSFQVRVRNAGGGTGHYRVHASGVGPGATVRYYSGRTDVTRRVRSRRGWPVQVDQASSRGLRAVLTAGAEAKSGSIREFQVSTLWRGDVRMVDAVRARVRISS